MMNEKFTKALVEVYASPAGKLVLDALWRDHVVGNLNAETHDATMQKIGARDVILGLFQDLETTSPSHDEE